MKRFCNIHYQIEILSTYEVHIGVLLCIQEERYHSK